jgi:type VI secretion system protein ImpK
MHDHVAELVYPVFNYGLTLRDQLAAGDAPDISMAQEALKDLLTRDPRWNQYGGAIVIDPAMSIGILAGGRPQDAGRYLGLRYALVCWVDEILINSPWGDSWLERILEWELYRSRDRAHQFWDQARRAERDPHARDDLEVFFLCVMLGFRGDRKDQPDRLVQWVERVRPAVVQNYPPEPPQPDKSVPPNYVPWLTGRKRFQTMVMVWGLAVLALLVFGVVRKFLPS